ncbi:NDP-hexose 2,3-dehydratase family protein [Nocardia terpenica]|uniref:NDP-hexose 2,3-dehydratase family protein n=1 Tax=Nocardia terpenica TaxID=455432 RepID=UPI0018946CD2|nr:NDP-hexose 2,3-dehydratase family protein [Nocardia terpenica]MBF6063299.1 NDP-hexose 2,3-dehydratase family protein [Nocardia terpenica]MBF6105855.1 NDP-hexose 2,3-dehydratase family protein [Nocardia terpenica]MBF6113561.1 NDP-hexose 2,3-dehydratase family protein [Nocardia terpenica]MBF6119596.1 NDP-hexose 2,3-dehydratase family protein [Nocardia terpenica]MBF6152007.1 NDP-hexose 2,3-dehydratase family protein [Nocardia terpenica]
MSTAEFHEWFAACRRRNHYRVTTVPFDRLDGWSFEEESQNLTHRSGRFFSIQGLAVDTDHREIGSWTQPIIVQPEIGILGILVKEINGVLHCLMQAKMEPGNVNTLQLSPTVQATHSNYTRVHGGNPIPYLEHFLSPRRGRVLVDALQSEQGSWFLRKRNRNIIVETTDDVPLHQDFCWLTIGQLHDLMRIDNLVNMDARTVLSGIPFAAPTDPRAAPRAGSFRSGLVHSLTGEHDGLHDRASVLSWFTELKARHRHSQRLIPLRRLDGWICSPERIRHRHNKFFAVVGVDVRASNREVTHWTQPLLAPCSRGLLAFVTKNIGGVLHVLIQARTGAGTYDVVEMAPTVHCAPDNLTETSARPCFLDYVLEARPAQIRYDVVHSEEGGRFYQAQNRYLVVEACDDFPIAAPDDFIWMTVRQIVDLNQHGNYFNVEARSLLAALHTLW